MADNVKTLQTRIALKYDTYANWTDETKENQGANLVLLKGELGFCEIPSGNANAQTAPTVLFKVGDGETPFKTLKWASALAADVYSWAKASDVVLEGKSIKFVGVKDAEGNDKKITLEYLTEAEVNAKVKVVSDKVDGLTTRVADLEAKFDGETSVDAQISGLDTRLGTAEQAITDLGTDKLDKSDYDAYIVGKSMSDDDLKAYADQAEADAIAAAEKASEAKVATERTRIGALEGRADDIEDRLEAIEGDEGAIAEALAAAKTYAENQASTAQMAAQGYADGVAATAKSEAIAAAKQETESQIATLTSAVTTKDAELEGKITDNTTAINNEKTAREEADLAINNKLVGIGGTDEPATVVVAIEAAKTAAATTAQEKVDALANGQVNTNKEAITALTETVSTEIARVEGLVTAEKERAEDIEEDFEGRIAAMEAFFEGAAKDEGEGESLKNALDTLKEIQDYITSDGQAGKDLLDAVDANADAIADLEAEFTDGRVAKAEGNITSLTTRMGAAEEAIGTKLATEDFNTWKEGHVGEAADHAKTATEITTEITTAVSDEASARATAIESAVKTINGTIAGVKSTAEDAQTRVAAVEGRADTIESKVSTLEGSMATAQGDITTLSNNKLDKSVYDVYIADKAMSDANLKKYAEDEADAAQSAAKDYTDAEVAKLITKDAELAGDIADNTQAIADEKTAREGAVSAINTKIGTVADGKDVVTMISDAQEAAESNAATTAQGKVDALANGQVKTNTDAIDGLKTRVGNIESDYLRVADLFIIDCGSSTEVIHEKPSND